MLNDDSTDEVANSGLPKEFAENRFIIIASAEEINMKGFEQFLAGHGSDMAKGYAMAVADMAEKLEWIMWRKYNDSFIPESQALIKTKTKIFHQEMVSFLEAAKSIDWNNPEISHPTFKNEIQ